MKEIYVVGLTGPTGAGKSTVAKIFREKGVAVIDADVIARKVADKSEQGLKEIVVAFGNVILNDDGTLNRKKLADIAFASAENTKKLDDAIHPLIIMEIRKAIRSLAKEGVNLVIIDAALLFESKCDLLCNDVICVVADNEIRKKRIIERDDMTEEQALRRMFAQKDNEYYISHSNHIISNNGDLFGLKEQLREIADQIRKDANEVHR